MRINDHSKFILTSISEILKETVLACESIGDCIESQSLSEYVLQTCFLKMTGASEQKLKCICWELASNDFEYRYKYLKKKHGECSNYEEKNKVFLDLVSLIKKLDGDFVISDLFSSQRIPTIEVENYINQLINKKISDVDEIKKAKDEIFSIEDKTKMRNGLISSFHRKGLKKEEEAHLQKIYYAKQSVYCVLNILDDSTLEKWAERSYSFFSSNWYQVFNNDFANESLLGNEMEGMYTSIVFQHRNRCAHNLTSYQENLPTLKTLVSEDYNYMNYFFRFAFLILLDNIFIDLYTIYLQLLENRV